MVSTQSTCVRAVGDAHNHKQDFPASNTEVAGKEQESSSQVARKRGRESENKRGRQRVRVEKNTSMSKRTGEMNTWLPVVEALTSHWFTVIRLLLGHATLLSGGRHPRRRWSPMARIWDRGINFSRKLFGKSNITLQVPADGNMCLAWRWTPRNKVVFALLFLQENWMQTEG